MGKQATERRRRTDPTTREMQWRKPGIEVIKINCDGAWNCQDRMRGTGFVTRDHTGAYVDGCNLKGRDTNALNTEARAILQGITLA